MRQLQSVFVDRLASDIEQLNGLLGALASGVTSADRTYEEIEAIAHRVCGSAGIFDLPSVSGIAKRLELAAEAASAPGTIAAHLAELGDELARLKAAGLPSAPDTTR